MTENPKSISSNTLAIEAVGIMDEYKITSLFVLDESESGDLVGF